MAIASACSGSPFTIRAMTRADLPAAMAIQRAAYPAHLQEGEAAFASKLEAGGALCSVAERGGAGREGAGREGEIFAYCLAHGWRAGSPPALGAVLQQGDAAQVLFIHDLCIAASARGSGAGRRMAEHCCEAGRAAGLTRAELVAVSGAAPFWRSMGFTEGVPDAALRAKLAGYGADARWMWRELGAKI
ncbi:GNAT family N-acetyltransferase [Croceicoccus sp. Ery15]|uniref:GNAT family N-acetyltransferase n=1 Tax=Croceicoccus sp. Ery15 TaxID=1703338 RepID=UPI001E5ABBDD|nr:GNAT family N-acetyltransferase [Croceicoccus sp. Ery15]